MAKRRACWGSAVPIGFREDLNSDNDTLDITMIIGWATRYIVQCV